MNWWQQYRARKNARELLTTARKLMRMYRDILEPCMVQSVDERADQLETALRDRQSARDIEKPAKDLEKVLQEALPRPANAGFRENIEVLLVAVIVAMGVRTFFLQPFKIPTGSMQPTLYGIYPSTEPIAYKNGLTPSLIEKFVGATIKGRMYSRWGYQTRGDHIFVDKVSYHFRPPQRGEVIVFQTDQIAEMRASSRGKFYIKRLIGIGGDRVRIDPPYAIVNDEILNSRQAFQRIYSQKNDYTGYHNFTLDQNDRPSQPQYLANPRIQFNVPKDSLFVLGDNSLHSYDGRYWGAFPKQSLVGRAVWVYWPFSDRFGAIQ